MRVSDHALEDAVRRGAPLIAEHGRKIGSCTTRGRDRDLREAEGRHEDVTRFFCDWNASSSHYHGAHLVTGRLLRMVLGENTGVGVNKDAKAAMNNKSVALSTRTSAMLAAGRCLALGLLLATPLACKVNNGGDDDDGGEGSSEGGANMCECPDPFVHGTCVCNTGQHTGCQDKSQCSTQSWCAGQGGYKDWIDTPCENEDDRSGIICGGSGYNPSIRVSLSGGVYHVNAAWLDNLIHNPAPVWTCDDAYVALQPGGSVVVGQASSGELLYVLGLRNGDIPLYLNSMPLDNLVDGWDAFNQLYMTDGETDYVLTVQRGATYLTFYYELV